MTGFYKVPGFCTVSIFCKVSRFYNRRTFLLDAPQDLSYEGVLVHYSNIIKRIWRLCIIWSDCKIWTITWKYLEDEREIPSDPSRSEPSTSDMFHQVAEHSSFRLDSYLGATIRSQPDGKRFTMIKMRRLIFKNQYKVGGLGL